MIMMMNQVALLLCVIIPVCLADVDREVLDRLRVLERRCDEQDILIRRQHKELVSRKIREEQHKLMTSQLKQEVDSLKNLISKNGEHVKAGMMAELNRKSRLVLNDESVAFHATLRKGFYTHYHINQTVVFDTVMLNMGSAYHTQHGLFMAPVTGVYIFSVSIMAAGGSDSTMVFIMQNGQEVASAIADARGSPHDQGSTTVVLKLNVGDEVWVSIQRHEDTNLYGDGLDSFMGCLITPF